MYAKLPVYVLEMPAHGIGRHVKAESDLLLFEALFQERQHVNLSWGRPLDQERASRRGGSADLQKELAVSGDTVLREQSCTPCTPAPKAKEARIDVGKSSSPLKGEAGQTTESCLTTP